MKNSKNLLLLFFLLIMPIITLKINGMHKRSYHSLPNPKISRSKSRETFSFSDDSSGSCCLCGLVACTCITGSCAAISIVQASPLATTIAWGCCFCTSTLMLKEIAMAYAEEKKNL